MEQILSNPIFTDVLMISTVQTIVILSLIGLTFFGLYKFQQKTTNGKVTIVAFAAAIVIGFGILLVNGKPETTETIPAINEINAWLSIITSTYINLMKFLAVPIVFFVIAKVFANGFKVKDGFKTFFTGLSMLLIMVFIASVIGVIVSLIFLPHAELTANAGTVASNLETVLAKQDNMSGIPGLVTSFVPNSPQAMLSYVMIFGTLIIGAIIGVAINNTKSASSIKNIIIEACNIMDTILRFIWKAMPFVIFAFTISAIISQGMQVFTAGWGLLVTTYVGLVFVFLSHLLINYLFGISPIDFIKNSWKLLLTAFTTESSLATLPLTIDVATNNLDNDAGVATIVGTTSTQMAFSACSGLWPTIVIIATCMMFGITLNPATLIAIMFITPLASLGLPTMPGSATTALVVTMTILGFQPEIIATAMAISFAGEIFIDMGRTATNISGALTAINVTNKLLKK